MTDDDIKRLRSLANAATPGPWEYRALPDGAHGVAHPHGWVDVVIGVGESQAPDTRYIAAVSPDVLLRLIERLEAAEKDAARYRWIREGIVAVTEGYVSIGEDEYQRVYGARCPRITKRLRLRSLHVENDDVDTAIDAAMVGSGGSGA